jgi:type IV pilus assembly protein PilO
MGKIKLSLDFIAPVFEKIERLTKVQRLLISFGALLIIVSTFVYFSYLPKFKKIGVIKKESKQVEKDLNKAKLNAKQINRFRHMMKESRVKFNTVIKALPDKQEIPSLLANISKSGQDVGLKFLLFQPKPEIEKEDFAEIPVSIKVVGNYHSVALFFDRVANLTRYVNIKDISMAPQKVGNELLTKCTAVTYKFIEEPSKKASPTKKTKKSKKKKKGH